MGRGISLVEATLTMRVNGPPCSESFDASPRRLGNSRKVARVLGMLLVMITVFAAVMPSAGSVTMAGPQTTTTKQSDDGTPVSLGSGTATPPATPAGTPAPMGTPVSRPTRPPEVPISERPLNVACYIPARQAVSFASGAQTPTPVATPQSGDGISDLDLVSLEATPIPPASVTWAGVPAGTADEMTARDIERLVRILATCLNEANYETTAAITDDDFRGFLIGTDEPVSTDSFLAYAQQFPVMAISIVSVKDVEILENGDATATVQYQVGKQLLQEQWTFSLFVPDAEFRPQTTIAPPAARWIITGQEPQAVPVPDGATELSVEIDDSEMDLSEDTVTGESVVLQIRNNGEQDHEVVVLRLEGGATTADILVNPGPTLPAGITAIGQQTVLAGEQAQLILTGLEPGDYALVDLLPDVSGVPFLALGVEAAFTVEAA